MITLLQNLYWVKLLPLSWTAMFSLHQLLKVPSWVHPSAEKTSLSTTILVLCQWSISWSKLDIPACMFLSFQWFKSCLKTQTFLTRLLKQILHLVNMYHAPMALISFKMSSTGDLILPLQLYMDDHEIASLQKLLHYWVLLHFQWSKEQILLHFQALLDFQEIATSLNKRGGGGGSYGEWESNTASRLQEQKTKTKVRKCDVNKNTQDNITSYTIGNSLRLRQTSWIS